MFEKRSTFTVLAASAMTLAGFATPAGAQSTWAGLGGNGNWSQASNWSPSGAPANGSALVFSGTTKTTATNNLTSGTFASILFANDGSAGKAAGFTLSGSAFTLSSGSLTAVSTSGTVLTNSLNLEITFPTTATFNIGANQIVTTRSGKGFTIQGGNGLVKTGAGLLELGMANTLTGSVSLQAGTMRVYGTGSGVDPFSSSSGVNFDGSGVRLQFDSFDYSIAAPINVKESGTIQLSRNNTGMSLATGTISLSAGRTLSLVTGNSGNGTDFNNTLSSPFVTLGSGTLSFSGGSSRIGLIVSGTTTLGGNLTVESLNTTGTTNFSGPITDGTGSYGVTFTGNKFITLSASNAYKGDTAINQTAGVVSLGNASAIPAGAGRGNFSMSPASGTATLDLNGRSIQLNGFSSSGAGQSVIDNTSGTAATLTFGANDGTGTFGGVIRNTSGMVSLVKTGGGSITLSGSNTFSGDTTISAGILSIGGTSVLGSTSGVSIADGAGLTYTGGTTTFGKNITISSGTGTVRNSGAGTLALSGTLTKNGTVLRLTGGSFNVTGQIVGANANSDLLVDGTSTVTLSTANTYNGPTFVNQSSNLVLGINNAIPSGSVVTLGNATTTGTLTAGSYTNALGGLAFGAAGGTLRMTASSTSAAPLTAATGTMTLTNGTLDLAGSGTSAGLYRLLSAQSIGGSFASVTGTSAAYKLVSTSTSVDYQQRAVLGAVSVTNPAAAIITGGSAAFTFAVANNALSGGETLSVTAAGLTSVSGSASGSALGGGSSGSLSGLVFSGTSVGSSQNGTFTVSAPSAYGSTSATGTVSVMVLDHALPGFQASGITNAYTQDILNIDFGSIDETAGVQNFTYNLLNLASLTYGAGLTAGLDFTGVTANGNGFASGLSTFDNLVGGGTSSQFTLSFTPTGQGTFSKQFTLSFFDNQSLSGATARRDLTINAQVIVVPEPGALALAGIGIAAAAYTISRRRR